MSCDVQTMTRDWNQAFRTRAAEARIPIAATLELTRRCNLNCIHCYLGDQAEQHRRQPRELDTGAIKEALTEWVEAGCLYLTLTGGEPMLRPDFAEIYRHARELGLVVTVFTNGTLADENIAALFREYPPRKVEISLYGASAATHDGITGQPGSHRRAWEGIRRLLAAGVRLELKTVLMKANVAELEELERQAAGCGVSFRHDSALFPCLEGGSRAPLDLRISPEEAVQADLAAPHQKKQWRERIEAVLAVPPDERLYPCAAGRTAFHADPFGNLSPCILAEPYARAQAGRPFPEIWEQELGAIQERRWTRTDTCLTGDERGACAHCPAVNRMETGREEEESDYMRRTAQLRYRAATENTHES